jgi:nucleoside phosphorylase
MTGQIASLRTSRVVALHQLREAISRCRRLLSRKSVFSGEINDWSDSQATLLLNLFESRDFCDEYKAVAAAPRDTSYRSKLSPIMRAMDEADDQHNLPKAHLRAKLGYLNSIVARLKTMQDQTEGTFPMIVDESSMDRSCKDFVIVTALEEECDALLALLPGHRKHPPTEHSVRVFYTSNLPTTFADGSKHTYSVVVFSLLNMGRVEAATAATDAIRQWNPRYVLLVGIAGGINERGINLGDVIVANQIVDYELQKLTAEGPQIRYEVHRADPGLLAAVQNLRTVDWLKLVTTRRPQKGKPERRIGPIATGDKVVAFKDVLAKYQDAWPKLIGVEMEAGGVAHAAFQARSRPGFLMIRGVSDLADEQKDSAPVKSWRLYACGVAAAYTIFLLKSGPILAKKPLKSRSPCPRPPK